MAEKHGDKRGLLNNVLWLAALLALLAAIGHVWKNGLDFFKPSRESAVVKVFRSASPAVVNITAEPHPDGQYGFSDLLRRFYGLPQEKLELNYGSGIIVDPEGFILTNEHVINNTASIKVKLVDGRTTEAEVWGTDPSLDLAVLKVNVDWTLPYLDMGSSKDLMIGEQVIVIGNPLGLGHTCTTGIISSLHRAVRAGGRLYRDLVQIDAAVNPGNSGGPLLNIRGELIGVTSALSPEAEGIGFAIPIDLARQAVDSLIEFRYVPSGWIGLSVEDFQETAAAFGLPEREGVFVSRVDPDGPVAKAIRAGDVIESWNGEPIGKMSDFVSRARKLQVAQKVALGVTRDGERKKVGITARAFPESLAEDWVLWHLGFEVEERPAYSGGLGMGGDEGGVYISRIAPNSPASSYGLAVGDLIIGMNRERVNNLEDFRKVTARMRGLEYVLLRIKRGKFRAVHTTVPIKAGGERW